MLDNVCVTENTLHLTKSFVVLTCCTRALYEELCRLANAFVPTLGLVWHYIEMIYYRPHCPTEKKAAPGEECLAMTYVMTQLDHSLLSVRKIGLTFSTRKLQQTNMFPFQSSFSFNQIIKTNSLLNIVVMFCDVVLSQNRYYERERFLDLQKGSHVSRQVANTSP